MNSQMTKFSVAESSTMGENVQKKRRCSYNHTNDNGHEDRLSSLPDGIINDILSRLPFESAVSTGILSRRWFGLWKELTSLRINSNFVLFGCYRKFFRVITDVLHQLSSPQINNFECQFPLPPIQEEQLFKLLIQKICYRHVKELKVTFADHDYNLSVLLPSVVLENQQLEVLVLGFSLTYRLPENGVNLPKLRKLDICIYDWHLEFVAKLVKSCPVLEDLQIQGGLRYDQQRCLYICALNLKSLNVTMTHRLELTEVLIDAPKLENFYVEDGPILSKYSFARNPNRLQIVLVNTKYKESLWLFIKSIGNARSLVLQGEMCRAFYHMNDYELPNFEGLTNLELVLHFPVFWKALMRFLQFCPNLQTVILKRTDVAWYGTGWIELDVVPICLSTKVKSIWLRNFDGVQQELELISYILMVAKVLENLHVNVSAPNTVKPTSLQLRKKSEFCEGLYRLPKSSSICQISVTGPCLPQ